MRSLFADVNNGFSFGQNKLPLHRQGPSLPENIRWTQNNVMFVGLHIPGSNNGLSTAEQYAAQAKTEYKKRNTANLKFLSQSFEIATSVHDKN